jgi:hypothetical protein
MTIAVMRLQLNLLRAVEPGHKTSISFLSRRRNGGMPSFSMHPTRNRSHTIEVTTTTTQHRDYPPTPEFFQLRSVGESRQHDHEPYRPPRRASGRGQSEWQNDGDPRVEDMRAILNSRGRVILREVDSLEVQNWEKARSREWLV